MAASTSINRDDVEDIIHWNAVQRCNKPHAELNCWRCNNLGENGDCYCISFDKLTATRHRTPREYTELPTSAQVYTDALRSAYSNHERSLYDIIMLSKSAGIFYDDEEDDFVCGNSVDVSTAKGGTTNDTSIVLERLEREHERVRDIATCLGNDSVIHCVEFVIERFHPRTLIARYHYRIADGPPAWALATIAAASTSHADEDEVLADAVAAIRI